MRKTSPPYSTIPSVDLWRIQRSQKLFPSLAYTFSSTCIIGIMDIGVMTPGSTALTDILLNILLAQGMRQQQITIIPTTIDKENMTEAITPFHRPNTEVSQPSNGLSKRPLFPLTTYQGPFYSALPLTRSDPPAPPTPPCRLW